MSDFALLTAAKNEENYIENALRSVVRQTKLPTVWCIVDDGSSDRTAAIVQDYAKQHSFIRLITGAGAKTRSFGAQYRALNLAYGLIRELPFDFVGVQDADVAVERDDYYEQVLEAFSVNDRLGIAGGYICELAQGQWEARKSNSPGAVAGGIQMFRRVCFEHIGGYEPLTFGGEDWLAQIDAKRQGWSVTVLPELAAQHYRPTSSANGRYNGLFRCGRMDAAFGSHALFELLKCGRRVREKPFLIGSIVRFGGYFWENIFGSGPQLSLEQVT